MKHTKGPWYEANTGNEQGLIVDEKTGESIAVSYKRANARLIAASPDLLEACKKAYETLSYFPTEESRIARRVLNYAIAKAEEV